MSMAEVIRKYIQKYNEYLSMSTQNQLKRASETQTLPVGRASRFRVRRVPGHGP
jgi:hypothetical protein